MHLTDYILLKMMFPHVIGGYVRSQNYIRRLNFREVYICTFLFATVTSFSLYFYLYSLMSCSYIFLEFVTCSITKVNRTLYRVPVVQPHRELAVGWP